MLRAEELRIGNMVYNKHGECHEIGYNCFQRFRHPTMDNNPSSFRPIELTEDVLLKCGFEYSEALFLYRLKESNLIYEYCEEEDECNYFIHFYHDGTNIIIESSNEHGEMSNMKFSHIKYLHQLQNLYFALTGKELEIKL